MPIQGEVNLVEVNIPEEKIAKFLQNISTISKRFNLETVNPNMLMSINKIRRTISFQYGKSRENSKFLFQIKNLKNVKIIDRDEVNFPIKIQEITQELLLRSDLFNEIIISIDSEYNLKIQNMKEIEGAFLNFVSKEIQIYNQDYVDDLLFEYSNVKWKFHLKKDGIEKFKKLVRGGRNKKFETVFSIKKLSYDKIELKLKIDGLNNNSTSQKFLNVINDYDNFPNHSPINYDVEQILNFFSLINENAENLYFSVDEEGCLIIEQNEQDITISGKFSIVVTD